MPESGEGRTAEYAEATDQERAGDGGFDIFSLLIPWIISELTGPSSSEKASYRNAIDQTGRAAGSQADLMDRLMQEWSGLLSMISSKEYSSPSEEEILAMYGNPMEGASSTIGARAKFAAGKDLGFFQKIRDMQSALGLGAGLSNPGAIGANANLQLGLDQLRNQNTQNLSNAWVNVYSNSQWLQDLFGNLFGSTQRNTGGRV